MPDGYSKAQADYDAQTPPEGEEGTYTVDVDLSFGVRVTGLTFDVGSEEQQASLWLRDVFLPRIESLINKESEPVGTGISRWLSLGGILSPTQWGEGDVTRIERTDGPGDAIDEAMHREELRQDREALR
jgi:hypothetical protein